MLKKLKNPVKRYIKYLLRRADNGRYQIKIIYFIDTGNPISDIDSQYEKTIYCEEKDLKTMEARINKNISKTQERIERAFYDIGASMANVAVLVNKKMR